MYRNHNGTYSYISLRVWLLKRTAKFLWLKFFVTYYPKGFKRRKVGTKIKLYLKQILGVSDGRKKVWPQSYFCLSSTVDNSLQIFWKFLDKSNHSGQQWICYWPKCYPARFFSWKQVMGALNAKVCWMDFNPFSTRVLKYFTEKIFLPNFYHNFYIR